MNDGNIYQLLEEIGIDPEEIVYKHLKKELVNKPTKNSSLGITKIPIKATTIQSSKGLSADLVFITHFDDRYLLRDKDKEIISDQEICSFLVTLSRAKKMVHLISTDGEAPTFRNWINKDRLISN